MSAERWVFKCAAGHRCEAAEAIVAERDAEIDRLRAALTVANNRLGNAVGALIDAGTYCTGVDDVTAGIDRLRAENAKLAEHPVAEYPHELWCPSIDVCAICADSECDGIGCISDIDPNNTDDQPHLEQLQAWVRLGRIQEQANAFLVVVENRS